ncbi:MAG: aminotransferase class V-fold PLP-dependent enzyme [Candidatus Eiseniibacteriota bacterium]
MPKNWDRLREDFPITKSYTYLANAAITPIPLPVYTEILKFYQGALYHGGTIWSDWIDAMEETRELYSKFIGADSKDEIAFTHSTSEGMNIIAHILSDKGIVISNELEFPSTNLPWINKNSKNIKFLKSDYEGKIPILDIAKMIDKFHGKRGKQVKTILTSHVQFSNGFRQDLEELGKLTQRKDLHLVVNATQSLGAMSLDVKNFNIDFMASNGHKWMLSSFGIGTIYIKRKYLRDKDYFKPTFFSLSGQKKKDNFDNNTILDSSYSATRFELGTPHFQNIVALKAAIKYTSKIGIKQIEKRLLGLTNYLIDKLVNIDIEILSPVAEKKYRSGIIVFKPKKENPSQIVMKLQKMNQIIVSARGKGIRVSPHFYNNEEDIDNLISALVNILK